MERFVRIVNASKPLTIVAKLYILDIWKSPRYASENVSSKNFRVRNGLNLA